MRFSLSFALFIRPCTFHCLVRHHSLRSSFVSALFILSCAFHYFSHFLVLCAFLSSVRFSVFLAHFTVPCAFHCSLRISTLFLALFIRLRAFHRFLAHFIVIVADHMATRLFLCPLGVRTIFLPWPRARQTCARCQHSNVYTRYQLHPRGNPRGALVRTRPWPTMQRLVFHLSQFSRKS